MPLLYALLLLAAPAAVQPPATADLEVVVHGIENTKGRISVSLFSTAEGFPKGRPFRGQTPAAVRGSLTVRFTALPPGTYAVAVYHDEDDNGAMTRSIFGPPTEPYGFSKNARGTFGPPKFSQAAITLRAGAQHTDRIRIQ
jgi:uncharacterized protein (DUF2141 family)